MVYTGWKRYSLIVLGCILVGMGYLGVLLPGLPTTPFLLGASYCFVRSSPRLHRWLRRSPIFGKILHDWEVHRGIRKEVKIFATVMVVTVVSCSIAFSSLPVFAKVGIGCLAAIGIMVILCVPTVGRLPKQQHSAHATQTEDKPEQRSPDPDDPPKPRIDG